MDGLAFISYRRDDTSPIAQALYLQLKEEFGAGQLFMDAHSIRVAEAWPERIKHRLDHATVLLALIGQGWLTAADKYGRRRLDDKTDWVRNEILVAMKRGIPIIPLIVGKQRIPREGLPKKLRDLPLKQSMYLRRKAAEWARGVKELASELARYGLVRQEKPSQPQKSIEKSRTPVLGPDEVAAEIHNGLTEWVAWTDVLPTEYPNERQDLRRTFVFDNFVDAMTFMNSVKDIFEEAKHHPRWTNEWNVVRMQLTTWDVDNRITKYDVDVARRIEAKYVEFRLGANL